MSKQAHEREKLWYNKKKMKRTINYNIARDIADKFVQHRIFVHYMIYA